MRTRGLNLSPISKCSIARSGCPAHNLSQPLRGGGGMAAVAPAASPAVGFASGHYHFSVGNVGRSKGALVMAKAAYRAGEALFDERTGQLFDYTDGAGRVVATRIMVREGVEAPQSREAFWNAAEAAEDRKNGRIATEFQIGLPCELTPAQRDKLLYDDFLGPIIERYGVAADDHPATSSEERQLPARARAGA